MWSVHSHNVDLLWQNSTDNSLWNYNVLFKKLSIVAIFHMRKSISWRNESCSRGGRDQKCTLGKSNHHVHNYLVSSSIGFLQLAHN